MQKKDYAALEALEQWKASKMWRSLPHRDPRQVVFLVFEIKCSIFLGTVLNQRIGELGRAKFQWGLGFRWRVTTYLVAHKVLDWSKISEGFIYWLRWISPNFANQHLDTQLRNNGEPRLSPRAFHRSIPGVAQIPVSYPLWKRWSNKKNRLKLWTPLVVAWITCGEWVPKVYALWEWSHAKRASDEEFART